MTQRNAKERDALAGFVFEHARVRGAGIHLEATSGANRRYTFDPHEAHALFDAGLSARRLRQASGKLQ